MPEVVEIALTALFLNNQLVGKDITNVNILSGRYVTHGNFPGFTVLKSALPLKVMKVDSKGKFMWFELKNNKGKLYYLLNTYGLSGMWTFQKQDFSHIEFMISDGRTLYFDDMRNFGTLQATGLKHNLQLKLDKLGPDLLKQDFTDDEFYERIKSYLFSTTGKLIQTRKNKRIINVLMDQTTPIGSGLGNYLAPESLYRAKISPHKTIYEIYKCKSMSDSLSEAIKYVTKLAFETADIGYLGDLTDDMTTFVTKLRKHKDIYHPNTYINNDKFIFNVYRQKKDPHGNIVKAEKDLIKGRTTYWVPTIQH